MDKKEYLIFDFDGTLVNSFPTILEKFSEISGQFAEHEISANEIDVLRELPTRALIKYLGIPFYKIPNLIYQMRKLMKSEIEQMPPFEGLPNVLKILRERGFALGILTSNSKENVVNWLLSNELDTLFEFICDESSFLRKQRSIKKLLNHYEIKREHAVYIGDETRDIIAAKRNAISSVAVTWGFNSERILRKQSPDHIAKEPNDLLTIFN